MELEPRAGSRAVCVDTPLRLRFDRAQRLGTAGVLEIRRADGLLADRIDLGDPGTHLRTVGDAVDDAGELHLFRYFPVIVEGGTVTFYPHRSLSYGQTYYVTISSGLPDGFHGFSDDRTWRFTTRSAPPPPGTRTLRVAGDHLHNCWRASFGVEADDFTLRNLTLHNTTPDGGSQAEAFRGNGERTRLEHVALKSFQDTLRLQGSGFVTDSYVEGDTDFVWGVGTVFVQNSELRSVGPGYSCQIRNDALSHGNVFVNTRLTRSPEVPDGSVYLARVAPGVFPYSQAVFIGTAMDRHVHPAGWLLQPDDTMPAPGVRFWEYGSTDLAGRAVDTAARHPVSRQLTADEAARWSDPAYVLWEAAWTI